MPYVAGGSVRLNNSDTKTFHFGREDSFTKTYSTSIPVPTGPHTMAKATATVQQGTIEVPYVVTLVSSINGAETQTTGVWRGVTTWGLHIDINVN